MSAAQTRPATAARQDPAARTAAGLAARKRVPPGEHADYAPAADRPDPVEVLLAQGASRVSDLLPIRHGRMVASPFAFLRGSAAVMAADLARGPASGLIGQACGDAHLANFGVYASPERRLVFDINDFDETHPGPWEWDLKRLAASLAVAGRANGFGRKARTAVVRAAVTRYRQAMAELAGMRELEVWYAHADVDEVAGMLAQQLGKQRGKQFERNRAKARARDSLQASRKLTTLVDGRRRIRADPPLIVPIADLLPDMAREELEDQIRGILATYRRSLPADRRRLLDAFTFVDLARKVVGVGSVGTRCWIVLLSGRDDDDPLVLQVKEAGRSVLADHVRVEADRHPHEGRRIVSGQRLMQATSDIFLGWASAEGFDGATRDFYVRQLRDWKGSVEVDGMDPVAMRVYAEICGWTLARAHARTGDRVAIAAYLGDDEAIDVALTRFAELYADQTERDHAALAAAVRDGRVTARTGI